MAVFLSKEEILGGVREVPPLSAGGPVAPSGGGMFGESAAGLDRLERILSQINGILSQVNSIRNNPTVAGVMNTGVNVPLAPEGARLKGEINAPLPAQLPPAAPVEKKPEYRLNEDGVKDFLGAIMAELAKQPDTIKSTSLNTVLFAFNTLPDKRKELENVTIVKFREWLPKLIM